jgi:predicted DNA-binding protein
MQTVSTKLDKITAKKFVDICNDSGKCQSEMLRELIETMCEDLEEFEEDAIELVSNEPSELKNHTVTIVNV